MPPGWSLFGWTGGQTTCDGDVYLVGCMTTTSQPWGGVQCYFLYNESFFAAGPQVVLYYWGIKFKIKIHYTCGQWL